MTDNDEPGMLAVHAVLEEAAEVRELHLRLADVFGKAMGRGLRPEAVWCVVASALATLAGHDCEHGAVAKVVIGHRVDGKPRLTVCRHDGHVVISGPADEPDTPPP